MVAELVERAAYRDLGVRGDGWSVVGLPPGYSPHVVDETARLPKPNRSSGNIVVHDATSFLAVIAQRRLERRAPVAYADEEHLALVAILDDDLGELAGWRDYRTSLSLRPSPEWRAWKASSGQPFSQEAFAAFVEEHAREFRMPSAADMLELATTIEGTKSAAFKAGVRLKDGSRQAQWTETINATGGTAGQIAIPDRFLIQLIPFYGSAPYEVEAWLRFRISDGHLLLSYKLDRPDLIDRAVFKDLVAEVEDSEGPPTIISGPAPAAAA